MLINPGGIGDRNRIALATSKGRPIPNMRWEARAPEAMAEAAKLVLEGGSGRELRSLASEYNCVGMVFATRRTAIDPDKVPMILEDDDFEEVDKPAYVVPGDIVVYERDDSISHVAVVVENVSDLMSGTSKIRVLSQWGSDGEYFHDYKDVALLLGRPVRFYSERKKSATAAS
jgi:hypothetical protein